MTREEKINQLNDIFAEINEDDNAVCYLTSEDNELIESAIEALEQEPCEDCISRKAVTDTSICEGISCDECSFGKDFEYGFSECQLKKRVDALPSVQPKPIECEDAISREAAIDAIKKIHPVDTEYDCTLYDKVDVMYVLEDLPSVQPKYNASEWCHDCSEYNHEKHCCPRYNGVIRKTVEEIKQQSCEDAISREEAIGAVANLFEMSEYPHPYPQGKPIRLRDIKEKLKQLPPIQPKTGHWVEYTRVLIPEPINKWEQAWYCSECGYGNQDSDESAWLEWNYCPQCGARMVEPQESEE